MQSLLQIGVSALLAVVTTGLSAIITDWFTRAFSLWRLRSFLLDIMSQMGEPLVLMLIGIGLFLLFYIVMQMISYRYFDRVNRQLSQMADGQLPFDYNIEVRGGSPFAHTAINMNRITDRLHLALEEERRAEQTKNDLITNVSHDLRTPLTSILGYLGLIEQDRYRDEVELRHYVQIAYEKSQRLNVLIQDLFDYTRMRNESLVLNKVRVNVLEMINELLIQHEMQLGEAGMTGKLIAKEPKLTVAADPANLLRVFENLLANAIAYGREGKIVEFRASRAGNEAVIEVVNYGEPISSFDLPYIFDRFYRVDKSRTQWAGGSGLGLAIVKNIVELHGGRITAESDLQATVFRVILPASELS